eukprot:1674856-Alexandrium_andersonii.AAC.1
MGVPPTRSAPPGRLPGREGGTDERADCAHCDRFDRPTECSRKNQGRWPSGLGSLPFLGAQTSSSTSGPR